MEGPKTASNGSTTLETRVNGELDATQIPARHSSRFRSSPLDQINAGGIGPVSHTSPLPPIDDPATQLKYERAYQPGNSRSLSGIALRAFLLGIVLATSVVSTLAILRFTDSALWRIPFFLTTLTVFHFLEFWTTARYNTRAAEVSSFLLASNGTAYQVAHAAATIECLVTKLLLREGWTPLVTDLPWWQVFLGIGIVLIVVGQVVRSVAMMQAGQNFNHVVQQQKKNSHQLVTTGIYAFSRHPSYFGFFWWAIGTQLVLGNVVCLTGYAVVLWRFFNMRIKAEETFLIQFFGDEYVQYTSRTGVGIPFVT